MKKQKNVKLALNRETLVPLQVDMLDGVVGGKKKGGASDHPLHCDNFPATKDYETKHCQGQQDQSLIACTNR